MCLDDENKQVSFEQAFTPIANHLFPDGCPDENLAAIWPLRQDRTVVSFSDARAALRQLRRQRIGINSHQLDSLVYVACYAVSGKCSSPLMAHFKDFLRCLIPKTRNSFLSQSSLQLLMLTRLDNEDRAYLFRMLILSVQTGVILESTQLLMPYYPIIFHYCQRLDEAIHLVCLLTTRESAQPFRAKRLLGWYHTGSVYIYRILDLYAKLNPLGCQKYLPKQQLQHRHGQLHFKIDMVWTKDLLKCANNSLQQDNPQKEPPLKRFKTLTLSLDSNVMVQWRGCRELSDMLSNHALLTHIEITEPMIDEQVVQFRTNLPFMLYEEWYLQDDTGLEKEEDKDFVEEGSDDDDIVERQPKVKLSRDELLLQTRSNIIKAIAVFSHRIGTLLPEFSRFILEDVVPIWDGSDEWGFTLCHDLLPCLIPSPNHHQGLILQYIEPLARFGSPRIQYRLFGVLVPQWIKNWGNKSETINLIRWASVELKRSFLGSDGHDLLRLATIEFYDAVRVATSILPNQFMVYTIFLSRTTVGIDHLCCLLMKYRETLLLERHFPMREIKCRIALYNSFVWDIVSACWRSSLVPHEHSWLFRHIPVHIMLLLGEEKQSALSITSSAAFIGYQYGMTGRVRHRAKYVDGLRDRGLTGLYSLLVTFVGALADRSRRKSHDRSVCDQKT